MGVLVMMWDIQDENNNNITSNNNNYCNNKDSLREQVFHWPQHSFLIEHFSDHVATLGAGLREKLQKLDIYTEEQTSRSIEGRISAAARRCGLAASKRIWFTFDVFLARNRPGLVSDPDTGIVRKKKRRKKSKKKSKPADGDENEDESSADNADKNKVFEKENLNILVEVETELPVRAI